MMAFNYGGYPYYQNGFQQQNYQQPMQQYQPDQRQQNGDGRIWVQGEVGAKAYLVAPGNTVALWDSEQQIIYLKTVMANGVPSMIRLNYTVDNPAPAAVPTPTQTADYVTRAEFEKRIAELLKGDKHDDEQV